MQMSKWQKILLAVFGAAVAIAPIFVKNKNSQDKLEEAAGGAISSVIDEG
jgi:maltodextrin utilization protein YvdJ